MNWINAFEIICYIIVCIFLVDIYRKKATREFYLFISAAIAGFALELLAVRLTDIYHYSDLYYLMVGVKPYQFPFFGGLMWGAVAVLSLRLAERFRLNDFKTAVLAGFFVVTMDLLLDVAAIRLSGGFWFWDGREVNLLINHHTFMSVIWVNFLGYMFETPSLIYYSKSYWRRKEKSIAKNLLAALVISLMGVATVGILSFISLKLNDLTDEWFSCLAFGILWLYIFIKLIIRLVKDRKRISLRLTDPALTIFWLAIYSYCIIGLGHLGILRARPFYGIFACLIFALTIFISLINLKD
ncbi:carotenoid biosynthesis protein [uncultured Ezakiella sp.]|uniref:carotenoid biosynthesis protein n=1 Tax=uncultured Ezakiella sp. TaxID=1637529 RepID=UPI0025DF0EAD|nr:carotenoid biosynthesis protein [uncultured Ezakiella sp.]